MDIQNAEENLQTWLDAEKSVASAQSYTITTAGGGQRQVTRAPLHEIRKQILFWRREIERLTANSNGNGYREVGHGAEFLDIG